MSTRSLGDQKLLEALQLAAHRASFNAECALEAGASAERRRLHLNAATAWASVFEVILLADRMESAAFEEAQP